MIAMSSIRKSLGVVSAGLLLAGFGAAPAVAAGPWWRLSSDARPAVFAPGGEGTVVVGAVNVGDGATFGDVTLSDTLPAGVAAQSVKFVESPRFGNNLNLANLPGACETSPGRVRCTYPKEVFGNPFPVLNAYESLEMRITVKVAAGAPAGSENRLEVSGGEAPSSSLARPLQIQGAATPFGVEDFAFVPEEEGGGLDTRAGSHPFQLSSLIALNQNADPLRPPAMAKDLHLQLPAGIVGNTTGLPQCSEEDFQHLLAGGVDRCPANTAVGVATVTIDEPVNLGLGTVPVPLFNLVPSRGEPARFGFVAVGTLETLDTSVRSGGDYGVTVSSSNITQLANLISSEITLWGVPGDPRHDHSRGWSCLAGERYFELGLGSGFPPPCTLQNQGNPAPYLTLPTSCALPFAASVEADSWPTKTDPQGLQAPVREYSLEDSLGRLVGLTGCDQLPFSPTIEVAPDTSAASTPSGLTVGVHIPQDTSSTPEGLAESALKDATVTLPEGIQVNPSSADGLEACSEGQVGYTGTVNGRSLFTSDPAECPDASKVGTVDEVKVVGLAAPLTGSIYLASPHANPFGSLLALYLVAEDPVSGVRAKLAGEIALDPVTGRLTSTFKNAPQDPIEDIQLHFFGGSRAPFSTPAMCGTYTTDAVFSPWSENAPVNTSSGFQVSSGLGGSACPGGLPFAASLTAGSTNIQAGGFTPFTVTMGRQDNEQTLSGLQLHIPQGLLGRLSSVKQCPEPQASQGTCGQESLLGHLTVSAGVGSDPYTVTGGQVFITGPYHGAPFGLSIAVPAKAGPFDLGSGACDCVVVRARIDVDPHTARITVTSDPFPTILQGISLQVKHINVTIDRQGFMFNPTNCDALNATGTLTGTQGGSVDDTVPFQVTNCARLPFKPSFKVSTQARTSKKNGASLDVKVTSGFGQANIGKVAVTLPKQLPSRLTTIQQACTAAVFNQNPASCPAGSNIGTVIARTPVLTSPVSGPAYLVSHGGAAFPDLVIVLQGEGVKLELVGSIDIKHGVTSSAFNAVPDAPIDSFELSLPEGPHSALAANIAAKAKGTREGMNNLCGTSLVMPTTITGQNGARIKQSTKIAVTGCTKAKKKKPKHAKKPKHGKKG